MRDTETPVTPHNQCGQEGVQTEKSAPTKALKVIAWGMDCIRDHARLLSRPLLLSSLESSDTTVYAGMHRIRDHARKSSQSGPGGSPAVLIPPALWGLNSAASDVLFAHKRGCDRGWNPFGSLE